MGLSSYVIRDYREDDALAIRDCIVELQEFEQQIDSRLRPGESMAAEHLAQALRRCREYSGRILVAECAALIVGFATVLARVPFEELDEPPGDYALVTDLFVREGFRRRGLGVALLREAEQHARAAGAAELRIGALSANQTALNLYRRAGFAAYLETLTKRLESPAA